MSEEDVQVTDMTEEDTSLQDHFAEKSAEFAASEEGNLGTPDEVETHESTPDEVSEGGETIEEPLAAAVEQAAWDNFKFSVMDKEHEFDEWVRPFVKDEGSYNQVRELYEKAYGLDYVKPKYEEARQELQNIQGQYGAITDDLGKLGTFIQDVHGGNIDSMKNVLDALKLSDEHVLQYAVNRLSYLDLPEDQRKQMDDRVHRDRQLVELQRENEKYKQYQSQRELDKLSFELDMELGSPEISQIAQDFEARAGKQGAFRDAVVRHSVAEHQMTGRDLMPREAVQSFIQSMGLVGAASQQQAGEPVAQAVQTQQRPATLPQTGSSGGSPARQKVRSLDDLKQLRDNMDADTYYGQVR